MFLAIVVYVVEFGKVDYLEKISEGVVYTLLTSLMISLIYDRFSARENDLRRKHELSLLLGEMKRATALDADLSKLDDIALSHLVSSVFSSPRALRSIASQIITDEIYIDGFVSDYLSPLSKCGFLRRSHVQAEFREVAGSSEKVAVCVNHTMDIRSIGQRVRIAFTSDNDVLHAILPDKELCDMTIGLTGEEFGKLKTWESANQAQAKSSLSADIPGITVSVGRFGTHHRSSNLPCQSVTADVAAFEELRIDTQKICVIDFILESDDQAAVLTISTTFSYDISDQYFCWFADNIMLCDYVVIDYSRVARKLGRVSVQAFVGFYSPTVTHKIESGQVNVAVNGVLWPGQGVILVWRPNLNQ